MSRRARWVGATAAAAALAVVGSMVLVSPPAQALAKNPWVVPAIEEIQDGTGQPTNPGDPTGAWAFVNSANGYTPGDDAPHDYVVASYDTLKYRLALAFEASAARYVDVTLNLPPYLELDPATADLFCQGGLQAKAVSRSGNTCHFYVPSGRTDELEITLNLRAKDTGGTAQPNQTVGVSVAVSGYDAWTTVQSPGVTVVSAPMVDVVVSNPMADCHDPATGTITATPTTLALSAYSPTKGITRQPGPWSGYFDVSAFPAGTTWSVGGTPVVPAAGRIPVSGTGPQSIAYTLPVGESGQPQWPNQVEGQTTTYPVRIVVDPGSFRATGTVAATASAVFVNNAVRSATGWQPGDGQGSGVSTQDDAIGAKRGAVLANNDFGQVTVACPSPPDPNDPNNPGAGDPDPVALGKAIAGPYDPAHPVWAGTNRLYEQNPDEADRTSGEAAPGTQLTDRLTVDVAHLPAGATLVAVGDVWDPAQQAYDPSRPLTVTAPDGSVLDPGTYQVQWTASTEVAASVGDPAATGWSVPPVDPATATAVRVVFPEGVLTAPGEGVWTVAVPVVLSDAATPGVVYDRATLGVTVPGDEEPYTESVTRYVTVTVPPEPGLAIDLSWASEHSPILAGDLVTFTAVPSISGMLDTDSPVTPTVTMTVDACLTHPVNTSADWDMRIVEASVPPTNASLGCMYGSPWVIEFTPKTTTVYPTWTDLAHGNGVLPEITFTSSAAFTAGNTPDTATDARLVYAELPGRFADDDVVVPIASREETATWIETDTPLVEAGDDLRIRAEVYAADGLENAHGGWTMTTVILPQCGDRGSDGPDGTNLFGFFTDYHAYDVENYDGGATQSDCHGDYTVSAASYEWAETTEGARLWYTTVSNPSYVLLDDPLFDQWVELAPGEQPAPGTTAFRLELPPDENGISTAILDITLTPTRDEDGNPTNRDGDVYVAWMGPADTTSIEEVPVPYPVVMRVVSGVISGTVWWDEDAEGDLDVREDGIASVLVTLHAANPDGSFDADPLAATCTDGEGFYEFTDVLHGQYVTMVHRTPTGADPAENPCDGEVPADSWQTYSWRARFHDASAEVSSVIDLPVGGAQRNVDYGFTAGPDVALDKKPAQIECDDASCRVTWDVTVTNTGTTPLTNLTLSDRMPAGALDVTATTVPMGEIVQVASGGAAPNYTYALTADGKVYAFGQNHTGSLGMDVSGDDAEAPILLRGSDAWGDRQIVEVAAFDFGGAAVAADGTLWTWGTNHGQLGAQHSGGDIRPRQVTALADQHITHVTGDTTALYALDAQGQVWAMGQNQYGQLGQGHAIDNARNTPVLVPFGDNVRIVDIAAGGTAYGLPDMSFAIALDSTGQVWTWGSNSYGSLGNGTEGGLTTTPEPVAALAGVTIVQVSAGSGTAYAVAADGTLYSWGSNADWNYSTGEATFRGKTGQTTLGPDRVACVDYAGSPFDETQLPCKVLAPAVVPGITGVTAVAAGVRHTLALAADGLYSWGTGAYADNGGLLGYSWDEVRTTYPDWGYASPTPHRISALDQVDIKQIAAGAGSSAVVTTDGYVYTFGEHAIGDGVTDNHTLPVRLDSRAPVAIEQVAPGANRHTVWALGTDGTVYGWGNNYSGRLIADSGGAVYIPTVKDGSAWAGHRIVQVLSNGDIALALDDAGQVYAWGSNTIGQLGIGTTDALRHVDPVRVPSLSDITKLAGGDRGEGTTFTLALDSDGTVWAWGFNNGGELGDGSATNRSAPVQVQIPAGEQIIDIVAANGNGYALAASGTVYAWGGGVNGALGAGETVTYTETPVAVTPTWGADQVVSLGAGNSNAYAVTASGAVYAWGLNGASLGTGDDAAPIAFTPVQVHIPAGVQIKSVDGGAENAIAVSTDGRVFAWGHNGGYGALGMGTTTDVPAYPTPTELPDVWGGKAVTDAQLGGLYGFVILEDGSLWSWGMNNEGEAANRATYYDRLPHPAGGQYLNDTTPAAFGSTANTVTLTPIRTATDGDLTTRDYRIAGPLPAGASTTVTVSATFAKAMAEQVIVNQAWVTGDLTPKDTPAESDVPAPDDVDPEGVPDNPDCSADSTANGRQPTGDAEDQCDQVPVVIPGTDELPGSLSGQVWVDSGPEGIRDGIRDDGEPPVQLFVTDADGAPVLDASGNPVPCVTVTLLGVDNALVLRTTLGTLPIGPDGELVEGAYLFENLPPGQYQVQFGFDARCPASGAYMLTEQNVGDADGDDDPADEDGWQTDSDASTGVDDFGLTAPVTVVAGARTPHVDAGVYEVGTGIEVVKNAYDLATDVTGDGDGVDSTGDGTAERPMYLALDPAADPARTGAQGVQFVATNRGDEPLTDLTWADTTAAGPDVVDWACYGPDGAELVTNDAGFLAYDDGGTLVALVLDPQETYACYGTLPPMEPGALHDDTVRVTGTGVLTQQNVTGEDPYAGSSDGIPPEPEVEVTKFALGSGDDGGRIAADTAETALWLTATGSAVTRTVFFEIANTGTEPLTDVAFQDVTTAGDAVLDSITCATLDDPPVVLGLRAEEDGWTTLTANDAPYVLPVGAALMCNGSLTLASGTPESPAEPHANVVSVRAVGVFSGESDDDDDPFHAGITEIDVEKFFESLATGDADTAGTAVTLDLDDVGMTGEVPVTVTITNTGAEALTDLVFADVLADGAAGDISGWACDAGIAVGDGGMLVADGVPAVLAVGDTITCTGTLPSFAAGGTHANTVTVTGVGVTSRNEVDDDDPFHAVPEPPVPAIDVEKFTRVAGEPVDADTPEDAVFLAVGDGGTTAESQVWFTITNTGQEPLTDVTWIDTTTSPVGDAAPVVDWATPGCSWFPVDGTAAVLVTVDGVLTLDDAPLVLGVGDTVTCGGTLPPMAAGTLHADTVAVTATGVVSQQPAQDDDPFHAGTTAIDVEKFFGSLATGDADTAQAAIALPLGDDGRSLPLEVTVTITNTGNEDLTGLVFTDELADGAAGDISGWACAASDQTLVELAPVADSGSFTLMAGGVPVVLAVGDTITCTGLLESFDAGETHANTVTVTGVGVTSGNEVGDDDPFHAEPNSPEPRIDVDKTSSDPALDGDAQTPGQTVASFGQTAPVAVEFTFTNRGNEALENVTFTDTTTDGPAVADWACTAGGATLTLVPAQAGDGQVAFAVLTGAGEPFVLEISASVTCVGTLPAMAAGDLHANTVSVAADGVVTGTPVEDEDDYAITSDDPEPDVEVEKFWLDGQDVADADELADAVVLDLDAAGKTGVLPVTVTITNTGEEALTDLTFTDTLADGAAGAVTGWTCDAGIVIGADGVLTAAGVPVVLAVGETITCTGTLPSIDVGQTHTNTVTVTGTGVISGDPADDDDPFNAIPEDPTPGIDVVKESVDPALDGDAENPGRTVASFGQTAPVAVEFTLTNTGNEPLTDVRFIDTTISGAAVPTWACAAGDTALTLGAVDQDGYATLLDGDQPYVLPIGASVTCMGTVPAMAAGDLHADTVTVTADGFITGTPVDDDDDYAVTSDDPEPGVEVEKFWLDGQSVVDADELADAVVLDLDAAGKTGALPVTVTITNTGAEALTNLTFTDTLAEGAAGAITDWQCADADSATVELVAAAQGGSFTLTADGEPVVLAVGDTITCTGTLPSIDAGQSHTDTVTATGTGVVSGDPADDDDPFNAVPEDPTPGIDVVKEATDPALDGDAADPALAPATDGQTAPVEVRFTLTNTGNEPLTDVRFTDTTISGAAVPTWACAAGDTALTLGAVVGDGRALLLGADPFVLAVGASVTCTGTVPAMAAGVTHVDAVEVTASGVVTGRPVADDDDYAVTSDDVTPPPPPPPPGEPHLVLDKAQELAGNATADAATGSTGDVVTYRVDVTNTGDADYVGPLVDVLTDVLDDATLLADADGVVFVVTTLAGGVPVGEAVTFTAADVAGDVLTYADGVPAGGTVRLEYLVTITGTGDGDLFNLAAAPVDGSDPRTFEDKDGDGLDDATGSLMDTVLIDTVPPSEADPPGLLHTGGTTGGSAGGSTGGGSLPLLFTGGPTALARTGITLATLLIAAGALIGLGTSAVGARRRAALAAVVVGRHRNVAGRHRMED